MTKNETCKICGTLLVERVDYDNHCMSCDIMFHEMQEDVGEFGCGVDISDLYGDD